MAVCVHQEYTPFGDLVTVYRIGNRYYWRSNQWQREVRSAANYKTASEAIVDALRLLPFTYYRRKPL